MSTLINLLHMVQLNELSKIGFGAYRVEKGCRAHFEALNYALQKGCNLIDTAANYGGGKSELLISEVLAADPGMDAFIVTKAGYVSKEDLNDMAHLKNEGLTDADILTMPDGSYYSIHPLVLNYKLQQSCKRLQRPVVDGFLLHNPEYLFNHAEQLVNENFIYEQIRCALQFLEAEAA